MSQLPAKPVGSIIEEIDEFDGRSYRWKPYPWSIFYYLPAIFLSIWLVGWSVGFVAAITSLIKNPNGPNQAFLLLWLALWAVGGILAGTMLYFIVRPARHESITLGRFDFRYDPGSFPIGMLMNPATAMRYQNPFYAFNLFFRTWKRIELSKADVGQIKLERIGERQRLYFDHGADRIEIGENLREPEREWLAAIIQHWQNS